MYITIIYISGWIVPVKDDNTKYPINSNTFYIKTKSVTGGSDQVILRLYSKSGAYISGIWWRFSDWAYFITHCTPGVFSLKFPVAPPIGVQKTWEVALTKNNVKIKCNTLQVLHYIYNNTYNSECNKEVAGKRPREVEFRKGLDSASKMFISEQVGKQ